MERQPDDAAEHIPVLLDRCLELLGPAIERPGAVLVDGTLGLGGHSEAALQRYPELQLVGVDRDPQALRRAGERLAPFGGRITLVHATFDQVDAILARAGISAVDGVLLDLGVSSMQLDLRSRGFAYSYDAPLDMRMDSSAELDAAAVLADYSQPDLARILRDYGEERYAGRIARAIVEQRQTAPITDSRTLVELLERTIPLRSQRTGGGHPAKRTFQALRIEVNDELGCVERALPGWLGRTGMGGRVVVMAYHSLEDRIVKRTFASATQAAVPPDLPVIPPDARPAFRLLGRGAGIASPTEISTNPRAASVRLRAVERIRETT